MRNTVIVLLILGLIAPAMTVSATNHLHQGNYATGGSGFSEAHPSTGIGNTDGIIGTTTGIHAMHAGDIVVKLINHDSQFVNGDTAEIDPDVVHVNFEDFVTPDVAVYYSFHTKNPSTSLFGGAPHEALETGTFCDSDVLERPENATHLRFAVNTPSLLDADTCPSGFGLATVGTWQAFHPDEEGKPVQTHMSEDPWTPPFR